MPDEDVVLGEAVVPGEEPQRRPDVLDVVRVPGLPQLLGRGVPGVLGDVRVRGEPVVDAGEAADGGAWDVRGWGGEDALDRGVEVLVCVTRVTPGAAVDEAVRFEC